MKLALAVFFLVFAACAPQTVKTSADQGSASAPRKAGIGAPITLKGQRNGETVRVTVVKVVYPAPPKDEFNTPDPGKVIAAVQIKIDNVGTVAFSDAVDNDVKLFDASDQQYNAAIGNDTAAGAMIGSDLKLAPGDSVLGYVTFQVPSGSVLQRFQFTPDSGFSSDTGEWTLNG